jgi:hypothetical protein
MGLSGVLTSGPPALLLAVIHPSAWKGNSRNFAPVYGKWAESNEELDTILQRLPLWGLAKWKVTPLETLEGRTSRDRQFIEQLEQSLQG